MSLDTVRMALGTTQPITGTVTTDGATTLKLLGVWQNAPTVTGATASYAGGILTLTLASGTSSITITP